MVKSTILLYLHISSTSTSPLPPHLLYLHISSTPLLLYSYIVLIKFDWLGLIGLNEIIAGRKIFRGGFPPSL